MAMYVVQSMARAVQLDCSQLVPNCRGVSAWRHFCTVGAGGSASPRATQMSVSKGRNCGRTRVTQMSVSKGRDCGCGRSDRECGCLGTVTSGYTIHRRNAHLKPADVRRGNDSMLRIGFMIAYPSLGLWMIDSNASASELEIMSSSTLSADMLPRFVSILGDLDPGTAQLVTSFAGPFITVFNVLFIFRIIMSWYPGIPVKKFPFFLAYVPTEPVLGPTRRLIPPVGGVDVAPVIWLALMSFANEILLGKQGLLVLLSQQQS